MKAGQDVTVEAGVDTMPVFVRAGSVIPKASEADARESATAFMYIQEQMEPLPCIWTMKKIMLMKMVYIA